MLPIPSAIQRAPDSDCDLRGRLARSEEENHELKSRNQQLTERNALLEEELRWLKDKLFGR